jgi:vitamin B12 transporter
MSPLFAKTRRSRRIRWLASTVLTSLLMPCAWAPARAQNAPPPADAQELPAVVVTSPTRIPTPVARIGSSVSVVTSSETTSPPTPAPAQGGAPGTGSVTTAVDIERDQRRTAPDALSTIPGLNIVQSGGPGGQTSIFMRGTNSNHTKVLIDGIDVSDPSNTNRSFDFGQLLTSDIERIEVLRGPQSGLYGADALGGVISITTKKGSGPAKVAGTLEGGSFGTFNQTASLSGSQDRFDYAFNVAHLRASDTPVTPVNLLPPGRLPIGNYYDNVTASTKLGVDVNENLRFNFVGRYTDATLRFTGDDFSVFPSVPAALQSTQHIKQFFTRGEAVVTALDGRLVNFFGLNYTDHWNWTKAPDPSTPTIDKGERLKFDWRSQFALTPGHTLLAGAEHETERLETLTTTAENGNRAGFVQLQSEFFERFFVSSNIRFDDNDRFGGHTTWRVAPALLLPVTGTKLKASYGTGFKAPTLSQMFVDFPAFFFFGNPNLKPEEGTGYDVGFEQPLLSDRVRFGATYFHNDIKNLIVVNSTFDSYANVGQAITEGVETFAAAVLTDRLKVRGDYTYTRAVDATTGLALLRRPKHKASVTVAWNPYDPLVLSATVLHVGSWIDGNRSFTIPRLTAPGYTVVNVAANYTVNQHLKLFARADNLFDEKYQNPTGFERPGLGVYAGMRLTN